MTDRLEFSSLTVKRPAQVRRELRNLWEGCMSSHEVIEMVGRRRSSAPRGIRSLLGNTGA
jgi:hypothetical protein